MIPRGGGGSPVAPSRIIVRRSLAMGDALSATVVATALKAQGIDVDFQTHPAFFPIIKRVRSLHSVQPSAGHCDVNLDATYEKDPLRKSKHFHQMWMEAANAQLSGVQIGPMRNCKPKLVVKPEEDLAVRAQFLKYDRPWVFVCPRSQYYPGRTVQDGVWQDAAREMPGTKFWLGIHGPSPDGFVTLRGMSIENLVLWLSIADLLVTVDTGPMHVAAALNVPIVAIAQSSFPHWHLNDQCDYMQIAPEGVPCLDCQLNLCPLNEHLPPCQSIPWEAITLATIDRVNSIFSDDVSAIVPIYQPNVAVLNRCLAAVLPQVAEVVVTAEGKSVVPVGAMQHPKIRYVRTHQSSIGFGRNVNFGARNSRGKYLLILNDDVFLAPNAVEEMRKVMQPDTGIVVHFLRYESGGIYPTVCARRAGDRDWFHVDHLRKETSIPRVIEVENACGASWLIRRDAFFQCDGYDEQFFMYCEDNDLSLRMRQEGWKILYTPHAQGLHVGHQSAQKLGNLNELCRPSIQLFHQKWDRYLEHNRNRVPLGTFDYA